MLIWCGVPAIALFLAFNFSFAISWLALSTFILNIKFARDESADIETYLNQVLA
ncbi:hypothetical protein Q4530_15980 [Colwellia sp. 1_MG-2023]|jgi:hypothetical protein|uniref:hypothetical protein n=1 Tax=unclassified Colwellia TaxID=196834 RepID=UPI001C09102D|nr:MULTISPECIES: hypothetical protein [unclassified Colwellia]MBU2923830.1 hypothetical protein [Colwellia sp. C2M11]MDO6651906.1 hypothetical protein [Colwellia sp. 3_MG-2023]MDO6666867.1 hypothetical protein [Colwellia sp. 2_MG-2023]MDO6691273.1 hypothetical protein [Colwellia sp. 1_MG-2023]